MKQIYVDYIAGLLGVKDWQVENCATLFEEGCTIPFISRYRKERTGGLDDDRSRISATGQTCSSKWRSAKPRFSQPSNRSRS